MLKSSLIIFDSLANLSPTMPAGEKILKNWINSFDSFLKTTQSNFLFLCEEQIIDSGVIQESLELFDAQFVENVIKDQKAPPNSIYKSPDSKITKLIKERDLLLDQLQVVQKNIQAVNNDLYKLGIDSKSLRKYN